jgi:hypothetical protein
MEFFASAMPEPRIHETGEFPREIQPPATLNVVKAQNM